MYSTGVMTYVTNEQNTSLWLLVKAGIKREKRITSKETNGRFIFRLLVTYMNLLLFNKEQNNILATEKNTSPFISLGILVHKVLKDELQSMAL